MTDMKLANYHTLSSYRRNETLYEDKSIPTCVWFQHGSLAQNSEIIQLSNYLIHVQWQQLAIVWQKGHKNCTILWLPKNYILLLWTFPITKKQNIFYCWTPMLFDRTLLNSLNFSYNTSYNLRTSELCTKMYKKTNFLTQRTV